MITARTAVAGEAHDHVGKLGLAWQSRRNGRCHSQEGRRALPLPADILDEGRCFAAAAKALAEFGTIDLLFNNAVYQGDGNLAPVLAVERTQLESIMQGNFYTPLALVKVLLPGMLQRGSGTIINMVSLHGFQQSPALLIVAVGAFAYPASKAALARMAGSPACRACGQRPSLLQPRARHGDNRSNEGCRHHGGRSSVSRPVRHPLLPQ